MTLQQQYDGFMEQLNATYGEREMSSMCRMANMGAECVTSKVITTYKNTVYYGN